MCGHVGVAGTMRLMDEQAFRDLLTVDVIRGPHSTGICAVSKWNGVNVCKKPLLPTDMFTLTAVEEMFYRSNFLIMGHNRWATQGAINAVNAHPFEFDTLVGTHNGTLTNQRLLPDFQDFEVDSENVFHSIQKLGVEDTWKLLHGAASLVWYDIEHKQINFLRNSERPMYITFVNDRKAMFYASEAWMLEGVLKKNGIDHTDIFDTVKDTLYTMDIPEAQIAFDKTQARVLTAFEPPKKEWQGFQGANQNGNVITGSFPTADSTSTKQTMGGTGYNIGDDVYFTLNEKPLKESINAHPFIWGTETAGGSKVKIYCKRNSWLRHNLECEDIDSQMYYGTMNGFGADQYLCMQENSIFSVAQDEEEDKKDEDENDGWSSEAREWMTKVIDKSHGCAWCADNLYPNPDHVIVDDRTIICKDCKTNDDVKDYLIATN